MKGTPGSNIIRELYLEKKRPLVVAHRGYAPDDDFERNTIPAFKYAMELGADAIECDLRLTSDGEVVVHHDPFLANWNRVRRISTSPLHQLRELVDRPEDLPTFQEMYNVTGPDLPLFLQIKNADSVPGIIDRLLEIVAPSNRSKLIIMGYLSDVMQQDQYDQFVWGKHYLLANSRNIDILTNLPRHHELVPIASPNFRFLSFDHLSKLKKLDKDVVLFTVNSTRVIRKFSDKGVAAFYTDRLEEVQSELE